MDLPIEEVLGEVIGATQTDGQWVLVAPPGAGKTTGVPPRLLDASPESSRILLLQPRRMAARAVAARLATLAGTSLGDRVGYQVRMDRCWGAASRIVVMTYGVLLRRLQNDPLLESFDTVLLDEFHERSLEADLALGMLHGLRRAMRPELRLGIMSATLQASPVADFLGGAPVIESRGRMFPVEIRYADRLASAPLEEQVAEVLPRALAATSGHLLVFLPGVGEIHRVRRRIAGLPSVRDVQVMELYGDLPPDAQDAVIAESGRRKIILSTNVAETSVTIPGVSGVIDSGLARILRLHPEIGLPKLEREPISRAAADQRSGRAGRTQPGVCFRLWMPAMQRSRPEYDAPEVSRGDLAGAVLNLYGWGETDILNFPWLTPPAENSIQSARTLLIQLGAIGEDQISPLGRRMLSIPAHPRLARLLLSAVDRNLPRRGAICAAMLSERDPFVDATPGRISQGDAALMGLSGANLLQRVERLEAWIDGAPDPSIHRGPGRTVQRVAEQFLSLIKRSAAEADAINPPTRNTDNSDGTNGAADEALSRALLDAFPDRLARSRPGSPERGLMVGGQGVRLKNPAVIGGASLYLCIEVLRKGRDADVRSAVPIEPEWLDPQRLQVVDECFFHPSQRRVVGRRRKYWLDLVLEETPTEVVDREAAATILAKEAHADWERVFPAQDEPLQQWIARVNCVAQWFPEEGFAEIDERTLREVGAELCRGRLSIEELRGAPWLDHLRGRLDYLALQRIDQWAPTRLRVPSGNEIAVKYEVGKPPQMSVRLQEMFGAVETPRVAAGRQAVLLRLLAPNSREVQVTQDLPNFWKATYEQVRKELRRRYPKHDWPEDPLRARATRSGLARDGAPRKES